MLNHHRFHALVVLGAVLQLPFAVMAEVPTCDPLPDHANYSGDHGLDKNGAWCPYDDSHFQKPLGVGCQRDSECQRGPNHRSIYPYTNGKDWMSINYDVILTQGTGICDTDHQGGTVCNAVVSIEAILPGRNESLTSLSRSHRSMLTRVGLLSPLLPPGQIPSRRVARSFPREATPVSASRMDAGSPTREPEFCNACSRATTPPPAARATTRTRFTNTSTNSLHVEGVQTLWRSGRGTIFIALAGAFDIPPSGIPCHHPGHTATHPASGKGLGRMRQIPRERGGTSLGIVHIPLECDHLSSSPYLLHSLQLLSNSMAPSTRSKNVK